MPGLSVLTVCSMNICRSPAAEVLLSRSLSCAIPAASVSVSSAGCVEAAGQGAPRCDLAQAFIGVIEPEGRSRPISRQLVGDADLILAADCGHVARVVALRPESRERTFTLLEAARLASWVVGDEGVMELARQKADGQELDCAPDDLRYLVEPLPNAEVPAERLRWLLAEMNAARGIAPRRDHQFNHLLVESLEPEDLPDPHILGMGLHEPVMAAMRRAVDEFTAAVSLVTDPIAKDAAVSGAGDDD
ncbi:MAG: hypothetical protein Q8P61_02330 [Candidatus Nanopelagicales bacterium]|nr:hypothetical protein [Candidatus Nanopelagicales bacterium]